MGIKRKLIIWTKGHTMKLALRVGTYISRNLWKTARFPPPSAIVMTVKNNAIPAIRYYQVSPGVNSTYHMVRTEVDP
jgi:hypothetical protein